VHALACALVAGRQPALARFLQPLVPGSLMPGGARVPGTSLELDPVQAAFLNALLADWEQGSSVGHPCQHAGALLAVADYLARKALMEGHAPLTVRDVEGALLTSHEIHAGLASLDPPLHGAGDPTLLLKVAQTSVITVLLGASQEQVIAAVTQAFLDGVVLPLPREGYAGGTRHRWLAADAASRAVQLALWTLTGEMGYPGALEARPYGFQEVVQGSLQPMALPSFAGARMPELFGGIEQAILTLKTAAGEAFRPRQAEQVKTLLSRSPEQLDARSVSEIMSHLVTHAVREASRQLTLLP
jgi:2-methylcitrate dehydratase